MFLFRANFGQVYYQHQVDHFGVHGRCQPPRDPGKVIGGGGESWIWLLNPQGPDPPKREPD